MSRFTRGHYVGHNKVTRVPRVFVYLDTESHVVAGPTGDTHTFRCGVAASDGRRHNDGGYRARRWCETLDRSELWDWIEAQCGTVGRTVLVAHNVAYDLRIMAAFTELPARGWVLETIRLEDRASWCVWRRARQTLVCVDTMSWIPQGLAKIGDALGLAKLELPDQDDTDDVWLARCRRDVEILAECWRRLMQWVVADDLGNWKPTGAGQSWGAFRHRFLSHPLFVHEDDAARVAERAACGTGRVECWRHGVQSGGPFTEWDYTTAYASIGRDCAVPTKLIGELRLRPGGVIPRLPRDRYVLAEVDVSTEAPVLGVRTPEGIVWPVGTFTTTAWSNEIALAERYGARVTVRRAWQYRARPALAEFCTYVLGLLDGAGAGDDPVVRLAAKHWARALVGRMGAHWSRIAEWGRARDDDVCLEVGFDADRGESFRLLHVGRQLLRVDPNEPNPDAMVAVLSWIMAETRCRLWRAMECAGFAHVLYCDTDSLIVDPEGDRALRRAALDGLRVKGVVDRLELYGPRQLIADDTLRAAGVPRDADRIAARTWSAQIWRGLPASLGQGESDLVRVVRRSFVLHGRDRRRRHLPGGATVPVRVNGAGAEASTLASVGR